MAIDPADGPRTELSSRAEATLGSILDDLGFDCGSMRDELLRFIEAELAVEPCANRKEVLLELRAYALAKTNKELIFHNIKRILDNY
ncbi:MAG TPA: hypothetical protein VFL04_00545 [Rectinemataceae bacterium]|nr:hypothetical protein [Rectinemataceae bacterium]